MGSFLVALCGLPVASNHHHHHHYHHHFISET